MKVRAIAIGTERSNAVGMVELECTPHGLVTVYLGVGTYTVGYAPGALTVGTRLIVPWSAILDARVEGEQVFLEIDPALTPHSRLTLTNFSTGEGSDRRELARQRLVVRIGAVAAALVTALLVAITFPVAAPRAGGAAAIAIAVIAALGMLFVGLIAEGRVGRPGLEGEAAKEAFAVELNTYLPNFVRLPSAPAAPPAPRPLPTFQGILPRTTLAIAITLTASTLGAVLVARSVLRAREPPEPKRLAAREPVEAVDEPGEQRAEVEPVAPPEPSPSAPIVKVQAPVPPKATRAMAAATSSAGACSCKRAESLLWTKPIPQLSTLIISHKVEHNLTHPRSELELAAINNGDKDVNELRIVIQFFDRDPPPSSRRNPVAARSVYFQGPLGPGKAIKWSVEARGSEFEVESPRPGDIGPAGDGAAPTNLLAELLEANHRPVRLHGAMMLAYLGDPRAKDAIAKLKEALRDEEAPYLDRLAAAVADVRVCGLEVGGTGSPRKVKACAFNAKDEAREQLVLHVRSLEAAPHFDNPVGTPPAATAEATFPVPGELAPHSGVQVTGDFQVEGAANVFEAFVE